MNRCDTCSPVIKSLSMWVSQTFLVLSLEDMYHLQLIRTLSWRSSRLLWPFIDGLSLVVFLTHVCHSSTLLYDLTNVTLIYICFSEYKFLHESFCCTDWSTSFEQIMMKQTLSWNDTFLSSLVIVCCVCCSSSTLTQQSITATSPASSSSEVGLYGE